MVGGPQEECLHKPYFDVLADLFYPQAWVPADIRTPAAT